MAHSHNSCDHDHHHAHAPLDYNRAFTIGIAANVVFIIAEVLYGLKANSLALLADAGHNASDVLGLLVAWGAVWLTKRKPSTTYTYGLQSSSILAVLANALFLFVAVGGIAWEAVLRLKHPEQVAGPTIIAVALLGIFINGLTALLFMKGRHSDLNIRGAFLHMATDALISLGVVVSGLAIMETGWLWLDPAVSLTVAAVILAGTWGLLRDSLKLALHAVPSHINPQAVKDFLKQRDNVKEVHDLHIWGLSTTQVALSAHLVIPTGHPGDDFFRNTGEALQENFGISHATLQIEVKDSPHECAFAPDHVV